MKKVLTSKQKYKKLLRKLKRHDVHVVVSQTLYQFDLDAGQEFQDQDGNIHTATLSFAESLSNPLDALYTIKRVRVVVDKLDDIIDVALRGNKPVYVFNVADLASEDYPLLESAFVVMDGFVPVYYRRNYSLDCRPFVTETRDNGVNNYDAQLAADDEDFVAELEELNAEIEDEIEANNELNESEIENE